MTEPSARRPVTATVEVAGRPYDVEVYRRSGDDRREVAVAMPTFNALDITRVAIESIRAFGGDRCDLWVIDGGSTDGTVDLLLAQQDLNVIVNRTPPPSQLVRARGLRAIARRLRSAQGVGSYANGVALELAARFIASRHLFVMHNDVLVCDPNWLPYALSRLDEQVRGVAMIADTARVHAMHCSGYLIDFTLFRELGMSFMPDLPRYDAGDQVTLTLRRHGYAYYVCANTFNRPETAEWVAESHPLRGMPCDRVFDDQKRVIYAHLGRGTVKTAGLYRQPGKVYPEEWVAFADGWLLGSGRERLAVR